MAVYELRIVLMSSGDEATYEDTSFNLRWSNKHGTARVVARCLASTLINGGGILYEPLDHDVEEVAFLLKTNGEVVASWSELAGELEGVVMSDFALAALTTGRAA